MDYTVKKQLHPGGGSKLRLTPPRSGQLRQGGGRKDSPGWTEHKRRANRKRFDQLRPHVLTAITFIYPVWVSSGQLSELNEMHRNFCKEFKIPARCVWEGPGKHQHIALGISFDEEIAGKWRKRLEKRWMALFEVPMPENTMLWKPDVEPDKIASYLSKTRDQKTSKVVKSASDWLTFATVWETGFRKLVKDCGPRKKEVKAPLEKEGHPHSPDYTVGSLEKEGEPELYCYQIVLHLNLSQSSNVTRMILKAVIPGRFNLAVRSGPDDSRSSHEIMKTPLVFPPQ